MSRSARALKTEVYAQPQPSAPRRATTATLDDPAAYGGGFPASAIQAHLTEALSGDADKKWSARKLLAFLVVTCGGFWLLVALVVRSVF